jgi:hypothetical protein
MLQMHLLIYNIQTGKVGSRYDAFDLYSDSWFESWPGHRLSTKGIRGFLLSLQASAGKVPQIVKRVLMYSWNSATAVD